MTAARFGGGQLLMRERVRSTTKSPAGISNKRLEGSGTVLVASSVKLSAVDPLPHVQV
jgi:uncharacterized protein (AIM24 family)